MAFGMATLLLLVEEEQRGFTATFEIAAADEAWDGRVKRRPIRAVPLPTRTARSTGTAVHPASRAAVCVLKGCEGDFEHVWLSRDTHLDKVPGFVEFHLLKGPQADDHTLYASHTVWESRAAF